MSAYTRISRLLGMSVLLVLGAGWRVHDDDGDVLMIPSGVALAPGETLAVGSGTGCVDTHHPCRRLSTKNIWGNSGDAAELRDGSGAVVDSYSYRS